MHWLRELRQSRPGTERQLECQPAPCDQQLQFAIGGWQSNVSGDRSRELRLHQILSGVLFLRQDQRVC